MRLICAFLKVGLFIFCLGLHLLAVAQDQSIPIDSLEQMLNGTVHDTVKLDVLDQLFQQYINKDLDRSLAIAHELLAIAEELGESSYQCKAYAAFGSVGRKMNIELDSVVGYFEQALNCFESIDDTMNKGKVYNKIGGVYQRYGYHTKAFGHYQDALMIAVAMKDTVSMIPCLANMSGILREKNDYANALEYGHKALAYARAIDHTLYTGMITNNIGNLYFNRQEYDRALVLYTEALRIKRAVGSELSLIITLANIGGIHQEESRFEEAKVYLDEAYELSTRLQYPYGKGLTLRYMANSAFQQNKYRQAIQLAEEGLASLERKAATRYSKDFHLLISQSYEALNEAGAALRHLKAAQALNDSLRQTDKDQLIKQVESDYEIREKELENKHLKKEKELIQRQLRDRNYISMGLIIILFLAGGWGIAVYRNNQARKKMNALLEMQVEERTKYLQLANKQLKQANYELETFSYIASHDFKEPIRNMGSFVDLISRRLPEEIKKDLHDYFEIIKKSTSQLYTLVEDLASYSHLSKGDANHQGQVDLGLVLQNISNELELGHHAADGRLIFSELPTISSNGSLIHVALKNLVENGLKFNRSAQPTVEVKYQSTTTHHEIAVHDNGIGIDSKYYEHVFVMFKRLHGMDEYLGSGIGLAMVQLAVEKLGGSVELSSQEGEGSIFVIRLPKEESSL